MFRQQPVMSKILTNKENNQNYTKHIQRLNQIKSITNSKRPKTLSLNFEQNRNLKRQVFQQARFTEIEKENKILLNKIFNLMQKSKQCNFRIQREKFFLQNNLQ